MPRTPCRSSQVPIGHLIETPRLELYECRNSFPSKQGSNARLALAADEFEAEKRLHIRLRMLIAGWVPPSRLPRRVSAHQLSPRQLTGSDTAEMPALSYRGPESARFYPGT